jgi:hypothetical protein
MKLFICLVGIIIFLKAIAKDGDGQYNIVNSRDGRIWMAKPVKVPKDTSWRGDICSRVLEVKMTTENKDKRLTENLSHEIWSMLQ